MRYIAVIPAREGSQGIKDKNTIYGPSIEEKPLVQIAVDNALGIPDIDSVILASDHIDTIDFFHTHYKTKLRFYMREGENPDAEVSMKTVILRMCEFFGWDDDFLKDTAFIICYLTYPLRTSDDIAEIIEFYSFSPNRPVIGLKTRSDVHPYRFVQFNETRDAIEPIFKGQFDVARRQDYPKLFEFCHYACVIPGPMLRVIPANLICETSRPYFISPKKCVDIDYLSDLDKIHKS